MDHGSLLHPGMNIIALAELADYIAAYFSYDASTWRPKYVATPAGQPIPIRWSAGQHSQLVDALVEGLRIRTTAPFQSAEHRDAVAIVSEREGASAQAIVFLRDEERDGDGPGVGYVLTFVTAPDEWPGWFAARAI